MIPSFSDHAANERTYLAWVRTGIAVIAFGFVIEARPAGRLSPECEPGRRNDSLRPVRSPPCRKQECGHP